MVRLPKLQGMPVLALAYLASPHHGFGHGRTLMRGMLTRVGPLHAGALLPGPLVLTPLWAWARPAVTEADTEPPAKPAGKGMSKSGLARPTDA